LILKEKGKERKEEKQNLVSFEAAIKLSRKLASSINACLKNYFA